MYFWVVRRPNKKHKKRNKKKQEFTATQFGETMLSISQIPLALGLFILRRDGPGKYANSHVTKLFVSKSFTVNFIQFFIFHCCCLLLSKLLLLGLQEVVRPLIDRTRDVPRGHMTVSAHHTAIEGVSLKPKHPGFDTDHHKG